MGARHLVSTAPVCTRCHTCGALKLNGLDEGAPYSCEPAPITLRGELTARVAGRRTYGLTAGELVLRTPIRIRGDARRGRPAVFAAHQCGHTATATDIDTRHLHTATRLIKDTTPKDGLAVLAGDTETESLFLIAHELGGRVVALDDTPPY